MRPDVPLPGTWRRDDGATSFLPSGSPQGVTPGGPPLSAPVVGPTTVQPPVPSRPTGPEMVPCPYCAAFEYEAVEGVVPQAILDHLRVAHAAIWEKMQRDVAEAIEKTEEEFV